VSTTTTRRPEPVEGPARRRVVVLDYGSGNLRSAERAVAHAGAEVVVTADPEQALAADGLVVPGVGAFAACMAGLTDVGGPGLIARRVAEGKPTLAICVGHQVLFDAGIEHGVRAAGCAVWPGLVEQLAVKRLPHMGWNTVEPPAGSGLFAGIEDERFYFVHSYGVRVLAETPGRLVTWAEHEGDRFVAAVEEGPLWSTQFHPEKSGEAGTALLRNWVATL
jgi:glutamine amidotransferase